QQVHRLPRSEHELRILQRSMAGLTPGYRLTELWSSVQERMAAVAEIYQRIIFQQQARTPLVEREGEFRLQSVSGIPAVDQSNQQLLEKLAQDLPQIAGVLKYASLSGRKNLLRFLSSAYGSSERYAMTLSHANAIVLSAPLFEFSDYLSEFLARYPEEVGTLAQVRSAAPEAPGVRLFDVPKSIFDEAVWNSSDAVFEYIAGFTAEHAAKVALLRRLFRHLMFASGARDLAEQRAIY